MSEVILSSQKVKSIKLNESEFSFKYIDDALERPIKKYMTF